ncbi:MAG TPA: flagellar hook-basal body complex protein FliE [Acidobacteriaceae bacterium]|nr:flagellar hook-basal body complex protein FliE [Acidobacteriaceae bacterium]
MAIPGVGGGAAAAVASAASGAAATPAGAGSAPFGDLLQSTLTGVDDLQQQAATAVTGMLAGNGVDIHNAMIATQKADMAFELALAVRNKAVAAYQQVMGMQF